MPIKQVNYYFTPGTGPLKRAEPEMPRIPHLIYCVMVGYTTSTIVFHHYSVVFRSDTLPEFSTDLIIGGKFPGYPPGSVSLVQGIDATRSFGQEMRSDNGPTQQYVFSNWIL